MKEETRERQEKFIENTIFPSNENPKKGKIISANLMKQNFQMFYKSNTIKKEWWEINNVTPIDNDNKEDDNISIIQSENGGLYEKDCINSITTFIPNNNPTHHHCMKHNIEASRGDNTLLSDDDYSKHTYYFFNPNDKNSSNDRSSLNQPTFYDQNSTLNPTHNNQISPNYNDQVIQQPNWTHNAHQNNPTLFSQKKKGGTLSSVTNDIIKIFKNSYKNNRATKHNVELSNRLLKYSQEKNNPDLANTYSEIAMEIEKKNNDLDHYKLRYELWRRAAELHKEKEQHLKAAVSYQYADEVLDIVEKISYKQEYHMFHCSLRRWAATNYKKAKAPRLAVSMYEKMLLPSSYLSKKGKPREIKSIRKKIVSLKKQMKANNNGLFQNNSKNNINLIKKGIEEKAETFIKISKRNVEIKSNAQKQFVNLVARTAYLDFDFNFIVNIRNKLQNDLGETHTIIRGLEEEMDLWDGTGYGKLSSEHEIMRDLQAFTM